MKLRVADGVSGGSACGVVGKVEDVCGEYACASGSGASARSAPKTRPCPVGRIGSGRRGERWRRERPASWAEATKMLKQQQAEQIEINKRVAR